MSSPTKIPSLRESSVQTQAETSEPKVAHGQRRQEPVVDEAQPTHTLPMSPSASDAAGPNVLAGLPNPPAGVGGRYPARPDGDERPASVGKPTLHGSDLGRLGTHAASLQASMGLVDFDATWESGKAGSVARIAKNRSWEDVANRYYGSYLASFEEPVRSEMRGQVITVLQVLTSYLKVAAEVSSDRASPQQARGAKAAELLREYGAQLSQDPAAMGALVLPDLAFMDESVRAFTSKPGEFETYRRAGVLAQTFPRLVAMYGGESQFLQVRTSLLRASSGGAAALPSDVLARNRLLGTLSQVAAQAQGVTRDPHTLVQARAALRHHGIELVAVSKQYVTVTLAATGEKLTLKIVRNPRNGNIRLLPPQGGSEVRNAMLAALLGEALTAAAQHTGAFDSALILALLRAQDEATAESAHGASASKAAVMGAAAAVASAPHVHDAAAADQASSRATAGARGEELVEEAQRFAERVHASNRAIDEAEVRNDLARAKPEEALPRVPVTPVKSS